MSYPNFPNKHQKKALVTPEGYFNYLKEINKYPTYTIPESVILCYDGALYNYVSNKEEFESERKYYGGKFGILKDTNNEIGIIANFGIGGPILSIIVEELAVLGVKTFLSIGVAGSLQKNTQLGSIIVCERAIRDEGTSHHYLPSGKYSYPTKQFLEKIKVTMLENGTAYSVGTSWTIDAPYRETHAEVKKYREEGVLTVEMEAASLFAVAECRNVDTGVILTISDYLGDGKWELYFHATDEHLKTLFHIAKDILA